MGKRGVMTSEIPVKPIILCIFMLLLEFGAMAFTTVNSTDAGLEINPATSSFGGSYSTTSSKALVSQNEKAMVNPKVIPKALLLVMSRVNPVFRAARIVVDILQKLKDYTTVGYDKETKQFCFADKCKSNCDWEGSYDQGNLTEPEREKCIAQLTEKLEESYNPSNKSTRFVENEYYYLEQYPFCTVFCSDGYVKHYSGRLMAIGIAVITVSLQWH